MENIFKEAVDNLVLDFDEYDYLLGDLDTYGFYKNNCEKYIDDDNFIKQFPITHNFILLVYLIKYVGILEGSSYLTMSIVEFSETVSEINIQTIIEKSEGNIFIKILSAYRNSVYTKYKSNGNIDLETSELINAGNSLIPIFKYLYSNSDEFK